MERTGALSAKTRLLAWSFAPVCLALLVLALAPGARADSGGVSSSFSGETVETPSIPASTAETEVPGVTEPSGVPIPPPTGPTVPGALATLRGTRALAPASAPLAVKQVIA
ncbi:hypothetical protein, partial [Escherichia coli]|uniref:hypothetical protein n=1 Tax=Escherichia coli TaxID=562 RepID=UPI0016ADCAB5